MRVKWGDKEPFRSSRYKGVVEWCAEEFSLWHNTLHAAHMLTCCIPKQLGLAIYTYHLYTPCMTVGNDDYDCMQ
jgi:hypothetical protein